MRTVPVVTTGWLLESGIWTPVVAASGLSLFSERSARAVGALVRGDSAAELAITVSRNTERASFMGGKESGTEAATQSNLVHRIWFSGGRDAFHRVPD